MIRHGLAGLSNDIEGHGAVEQHGCHNVEEFVAQR
jgi:hypothetical protein